MGVPQRLSSLSCELQIIRGKNIFKSNGHLFVRCHLSVGNNNRVRLDSHEISTKSNLFWNESLSLECLGTQESMESTLMQGSVIFEIRWRNTVPVLGKIGGSHLLARAEVPWKTVLDSPEMEIEKWVIMIPKSRRANEDVKPPALQIAMKVRVPTVTETVMKRRHNRRVTNWDECGCMDVECNCADYDMFALAAALEAF